MTRAVESLLAEVRANAPWQKHCEATLNLLEHLFANFNNELREKRAGDLGQGQGFQNAKCVSMILVNSERFIVEIICVQH